MDDSEIKSSRIQYIVPVIVLLAISFASLVPFYYYFQEVRRTREAILNASQTYEQRISEIKNEGNEVASSGEEVKLIIINEVRTAMLWEWSHERVNRRYVTLSSVVEWIVVLIILFLSVWQEKVTNRGESSHSRVVALVIPVFAALAIAIPAITQKLGFDSRQKLHDFRAQQLGFLITELEADLVTPEAAWDRYRNLFRHSPSSIAEFPSLR